MKADVSDIERLLFMKANKVDLEEVNQNINIIGRQLKHVFVILNENVKWQLDEGNET